MATHTIVNLPGDGIGPEITAAVQRILKSAGAEINWLTHQAGLGALAEGKEVLPASTVEAIREHKIALKGPCTTPVGKGFSSVNVQLRKSLELYAAVRPVKNIPGVKTRFENVDLIILRENTEGLYSGIENIVTPGVVMSMKVATEKACTRVSRYAFRFATRRQRKKITVFHKANIMKLTDGMFTRCAQAIHDEEYPNIAYEEAIIDAGCMRVVQDPTQFDILLLENLYGDVVSDLAAALVGGLGVVPGANFGDNCAIFEAVHGSAPDIAGKGVANPLALLNSAMMMLDTLGEEDPSLISIAANIRNAFGEALLAGKKTRDLGGELGTKEFADAVIERLSKS